MQPDELDIDKVIGANLSRLRTQAGYTQTSFGEALPRPLVAQQISKYELGTNQASGERLIEFARTLRCPVGEFFRGIDTPELIAGGTRDELELLKSYHQLTPHLQKSVRDLVHTTAKEIRQ